MQIKRAGTTGAHVAQLNHRIGTLQGPCVGCKDCKGLCTALIDALLIPEYILSKGKPA